MGKQPDDVSQSPACARWCGSRGQEHRLPWERQIKKSSRLSTTRTLVPAGLAKLVN